MKQMLELKNERFPLNVVEKGAAVENVAFYEKGKILDCNGSFLKIFGYSDADITGMSLFHFFPKIYRDLVNIDPLRAGELRFETLAVRKDSSTFLAEVVVKNTNSMGLHLAVMTVRDMSDHRELESKLKKSLAFQKAILDSSSFSIIATDFNGLIKTFNKGAEKMFRLKAEDVVDVMEITKLHLAPELRDRAQQIASQHNGSAKPGFGVLVEKLQSHSADESEWTYVRSDNTRFTAQVTATPLKDHLDEVTGYLFIGNDITDKKKAESEIVDKSQLLNGILSYMPVFVFKVGHKGLFTQAIGTGLDSLDLKNEQLVGSSIYDAFPQFKEHIDTAYSGRFVSFIHASASQESGLHYEYFIFPDQTNKGGLIGFAQNITNKINTEQKLKDSAITLSKANDELNQFAHIVSHDLKAPLRAISSLCEWIEDGVRGNANRDVMCNLSMVRSRVRKMQNLIDGILNYSRVAQMRDLLEEVDTHQLIQEVIQVIGVPERFEMIIENKLPVIFFNSLLMEQLFSNLISNAIKYHHKSAGRISIAYQDEDRYHRFSVEDDGPGIPKEGLEKIFLIFQTLQSKEKEESTGVGLAIVKKIAEDHGGSIWVESDGRSGSKFIFKIPKKPSRKKE